MRLRLRHSFPLTLLAITLPATAITTPQIIASALSPDCLQYRVVGLCYWLLCTPFGCTVKTSVKVKHNLPELVVSAYNTPGDNPWREMAFVGSAISGAEGGGTRTRVSGTAKPKSGLKMRMLSVIRQMPLFLHDGKARKGGTGAAYARTGEQ